MGQKIDFKEAGLLLLDEFSKVEKDYIAHQPPEVSEKAKQAAEILFASTVQSYREALLGCALARIINPEIDIRSPYDKQGPQAFSGRSLDEKVINPFLTEKRIPCSRGPYLASFRRNIRFVPSTADGLRDKEAYMAFLSYLEELEAADTDRLHNLLRYLLYRFIDLRDKADIPLSKIQRLSLIQYKNLINKLLSRPSGGLFPVILVVALLETVAEIYHLDWEIKWQGINVADRTKGAGGDVTVLDKGEIRVTFEVTERKIDKNRVDSIFHSKIAPLGIKDYLFVFTEEEPEEEAQLLAKNLFAQGHEVGFVQVEIGFFIICQLPASKDERYFYKNYLNY